MLSRADRDVDGAHNLEHLAASFAVTACGEGRSGRVREGRGLRSSMNYELNGEAAEMVGQDHVCAALPI